MNAPLRHPLAIFKERPFDGPQRIMPVSGAASIAEILAAQPDLPRWFNETCVARIDGHLIPRETWHRVRLKPDGRAQVVFSIDLKQGGGSRGGSKNTFATVASIAVLLTAAAISGGAAAPLLGAEFAAGTIGANVAGAAFGIGGALAIAGLSAQPSLTQPRSDGASPGAASLSGNLLAQGAPMPRAIGTHRLFPPLLCPPLLEVIGDETWAEAVYGLAGPHALSDINVGTTASDTMEGIQFELQEGLPNSPQISLVTRQSFTDTVNAAQMSKHKVDTSTSSANKNLTNQTSPEESCPQWEGLSSRKSPDEVWIVLNFPAGLSRNDSARQFIPFRIRIRPSGSDTWTNLPEFHIDRNSTKPFSVTAKLMWRAAPSIRNAPPDQGGPIRAYTTVPTQTATPSGLGGWQADSYFYSGSGDTALNSGNLSTTGVINMDCFVDRVEFYLNDAVLFPQSGIWEIQIIRGQVGQTSLLGLTNYNYNTAGNIVDFFGYLTSGGNFQTLQDQSNLSDIVAIARVSSIWNESPVPDPTKFAVIAVKVRGRTVNQLSVLASGYTKDWDGTGFNTVTTTSNPAPHLYDVLTGELGGIRMPAEIINVDSIVDWRSRCISDGLACNMVIEGKTQIDVLNAICGSAYARLSHAEKWGVFQDRDRSAESPIQVFTPRNMRDFGWTKAFARMPTGIRAAFNNSAKDYQKDEIIVYTDENNPDNSALEQINYDGLVTEDEVSARAAFDLLQAQYRLTFYKGTADAEAIVCQRGDLVAVQHDILSTQAGFSRIRSVTKSGGNITGLSLDGSIPVKTVPGIFSTASLFSQDHIFDLGATTGLMIRLKGGNGLSVKEIRAAQDGDVTDITFPTPFSDPGTDYLDEGCLVTAGRLGSEYQRLYVFGVNPNADMTAAITFVDEAPQLWN